MLATAINASLPRPGEMNDPSSKFAADHEAWLETIEACPIFRPTEDQFKDPLKYIRSLVPYSKSYGIVKIVPPDSWHPDFFVDLETLTFPTRVQNIAKLDHTTMKGRKPKAHSFKPSLDTVMCEVCAGGSHEELMLLCDVCGKGFHTFCLTPPLSSIPPGEWICPKCFQEENDLGFEQGKKHSFRTFEKVARLFVQHYFEGRRTDALKPIDIEREFWRIVEHRAREVEVLYGADLNTHSVGSGFPTRESISRMKAHSSEKLMKDADNPWNLNNIARLDGSVLRHIADDIEGVIVPWLYIGMTFSTFCWHTEDHHMYSINYQHFGAPKTWYAVPGSYSDKFEEVMRAAMPHAFQIHPDLLYQLVAMLSPATLMARGVPVCRAYQNPREFIVTFPAAYHAGFNQGVNCNEAVNFATVDWLREGFQAVQRYRRFRRMPVFSHEELVMEFLRPEMRLTLSLEDYNFVLAELSQMKDMEKQCRARLRQAQKDGMLLVRCQTEDTLSRRTIDSLVSRNCVFCNHQLFLSGITCECSPGKVVCLDHCAQLCDCPARRRCLHIRYTLNELESIYEKVKADAERAAKCAQEKNASIPLDIPVPVKCEDLEPIIRLSPRRCIAVKREPVDEELDFGRKPQAGVVFEDFDPHELSSSLVVKKRKKETSE